MKHLIKNVSVLLTIFLFSLSLSAQEKYARKYSNSDFYTNGVFNKNVAKQAIKDMLAYYGEDFTDFMDRNLWITDWGLGDYENVGFACVFWVNNTEYGYFAQTMYLLPGQMIPEHAHVPTSIPAKHESWKMLHGWVYNFSEIGITTANPPAIPTSHGSIKSRNFTIQKKGESLPLKKIESWHFMMAGPEGAIIDEYGSNEDKEGMRFTNPKAHPAD